MKNTSFIKQFLTGIALLLLVLATLFFILEYAENRKGFVIEKGWLDFFPPVNFSVYTFLATYIAAISGTLLCFRKKETILLLIRTYLLLQLMRAIILLLVPLDPPEGIIPLDDPFLHSTFYNGRANLKDLFFSGHVATSLMFVFILPQRWIKAILLALTICAAILIILQRVHYISVVIAAPLFSLLAFRLAKRWSSAVPL